MAKPIKKRAPFGQGIARLCAVAAAPTARQMAKLVCQGRRHTPTLELRFDWLRNDAERGRFLTWLKSWRRASTTLIATCRRREGGGKFAGSVQAELEWLQRAREAGCRWCDLEMETLRKLRGKSLMDLRLPNRILLSLHDFRHLPRRLEAMPASAHPGVAATKIAAQCDSLADSVRVLRLARRSPNLVAVPMGEAGLAARILALREGSVLAYAPVGEATAPGQVSLGDLKDLYRAHALRESTRIYGVIGNPVGHSLSPLLHNTGFRARRIDAVYLPFLVTDLRDFLRAIPEFGLSGFSVTIPHKESILRYLQDCDPLAAEIGAVNTVVVRRDGSLFGCNTDFAGILVALEEKLKLTGSRALILGAGGAARAAAFALAQAGAHVLICARRAAAARELAKAVGGDTLPRRALPTEFFDVILNATPVGMYPQIHASPLSPRELNCRVVMDLINRPEKTQLLKLAAGRGIATVSGVEMFIPQGIAQWELWTGQNAPHAAMRKAVVRALRSELFSRLHT